MFEVTNVRLPLDAGIPGKEADRTIRNCVANALGVSAADLVEWKLVRRAVDARKSGARFIATFAVELADGVRANPAKGVQIKDHVPYEPLEIIDAAMRKDDPRPLVVGAGPAGLFAALYLARAGMRPLLIERGGDVDERLAAVDAFNNGAPLDFVTNIQFGEGGAGTFSDGKLTTGTKDPLARDVLHWFVDAGAPEEILWQAKPHIGTDKLVEVVRTLRAQIEQAGGEVRFHTKLEGLEFDEIGRVRTAVVRKTASLAGFTADAGKARIMDLEVERIRVGDVVLACGHSARDTFRMLQRAQFAMEPKAFSVGVRIEHLQSDIDRAQYGDAAGHPALGPADYKLVAHLPNGRSVYTFCMCPGGEVVCAASEDYGVVVNGMSRHARDGRNANAALLVNVTPRDFPSKDPLAGTRFQRTIEQNAFGEVRELGGDAWQAPAQTVGDFLGEAAGNLSRKVQPTYARGVVWCDLHEVLPAFVTDAIEEALPLLDRKLVGFADPEAVMTGVETRSSSPVRILRDETTMQAWRESPRKKVRARDIARGHGLPPEEKRPRNYTLVYPCGEGPGYAGGIMSAAVDGLRVAREIARTHRLAAFMRGDIRVDDSGFDEVIGALRAGKTALFPTDTVWGIGVSVEHAHTPDALYEIKKRDAGKPIAWLVGGIEALDTYGIDVPDEARALARENWPGALTLVVRASDAVPEAFRSAAGTIGLRMPDSKETLALIEYLGSPLATTSANVSGGTDPKMLEDVDDAVRTRVGAVLMSEVAGSGIASTVVDCTGEHVAVLRQGAVQIER